MNDQQLLRYARHIQLDSIDYKGQIKILKAKALIIGVGGLGSPAAIYLASSGVGCLTIVDDDVVSLSNLQRQILFTNEDIGRTKTQVVQEALHRLNPDIHINAVAQRADQSLLETWVKDADVVLDCSDNFTTRHMVNQVCVALKKPLVSGAAIQFSGQISVFDLRESNAPCYACLFPEEQEFADEACSTLGIFAPLVGIIGAMQAAEALKLIVPTGRSLTGRLLNLDVRTMEWQTLNLHKKTSCTICG